MAEDTTDKTHDYNNHDLYLGLTISKCPGYEKPMRAIY
jgi:hypothetical protein